MVSRPVDVGGLGFGMKWNMGWMHDVLAYLGQDPIHRKFHHDRLTFSLWYAFHENFVLPLSHDEVVYGKRSLATSSPASLAAARDAPRAPRLHVGPSREEAPLHGRGVRPAPRVGPRRRARLGPRRRPGARGRPALDRRPQPALPRTSPRCTSSTSTTTGFEWMDRQDADASVISFVRKARDPDAATVLVVCNFTPVLRTNYVVGGAARRPLARSAQQQRPHYGGDGTGNFGGVDAAPVPAHGKFQSLTLTLPPLATLFFTSDGRGGSPMTEAVRAEGRVRAVVEAVTPQVDCGRFPAKRIAGDLVVVEADCFADGHDAVVAELLWRREEENEWRESAMAPLGNDRWRAEPSASRAAGRYRYTVRAWVDRLTSWRRDLARREDPEDIRVAARVGAKLVAEAATRARGDDAARLAHWSAALEAPDRRCRRAARPGSRPGARRARGPVPRSAIRVPAPRARRSSSIASARASARGTSCSRARRSPTAPVTPRSADLEARLGYVAEMGFDVLYLPPIHPIGREKRKGKNNALSATARDPGSPWAIGAAEGGHTAVHPELGTLEDFRRLVATARDHGLEVALDIAYQCAPDHPYVRSHPEWFRHRPDGTIQYAENPPKKYEDIYPFDFECDDWRALWQRARVGAPVLGRRGRADLPRRQPAHQEPRVLGVGDRRGEARLPRRDLPRRGVHPAEADALPREARLQPVLHLLRLAQLAPGAHRVPDRARARAGTRLPAAEPVAEHARHPHRVPAARRAARVRRPPRPGGDARRELRHLRPGVRARRAAGARAGQRGIPRLRKIRDPRLGLSTGPRASPRSSRA